MCTARSVHLRTLSIGLTTFLLAARLASATPALVNGVLPLCDAACQADQRIGLVAYYNALGGRQPLGPSRLRLHQPTSLVTCSLAGEYWYDNLLWLDRTVAASKSTTFGPVGSEPWCALALGGFSAWNAKYESMLSSNSASFCRGYITDYNLTNAVVPIANHCFWYVQPCAELMMECSLSYSAQLTARAGMASYAAHQSLQPARQLTARMQSPSLPVWVWLYFLLCRTCQQARLPYTYTILSMQAQCLAAPQEVSSACFNSVRF